MPEPRHMLAEPEVPTPVYTAPQMTPMGAWEVTTLAQSVPIVPGGLSHPFDTSPETW